MNLRHYCVVLFAILVASAAGQNEDELHIPVENDNQFPSDSHSELDGNIIEGSGKEAIEEPLDVTTQSSAPLIEDVQLTSQTDGEHLAATSTALICPTPCLCNTEGGSTNFVVDCSGYDLTEFPAPIDKKTTTLIVQNNKITQIPKELSALKNLRVLNANNNSIMELSLGSISELPELTILKLANNRLIEYPNDLKNGFGLIKLEELDLGGNDMRTTLTSELFSDFKALRRLTLPSSTTVLIEDLCRIMNGSLENVCTGSCSDHTYDCPDASEEHENGLLEAVLPGTIALTSVLEDSVEPTLQTETKTTENTITETKEPAPPNKTPVAVSADDTTQTNEPSLPSANEHSVAVSTDDTTEINKSSLPSSNKAPPAISADDTTETNEPSLRSALNKQPAEGVQLNSAIQTPTVTMSGNEPDVAVGATTTDTKTGGVDKSVIGMIIAGMIVVVAGITIKKNWTSIKNKFSSQRPPNDRVVGNANGTTPEEVPLQEKSPV